LLILKDLVLNGNTLKGGEIYDPRNGKSYNATIKYIDCQLHVKGYIGFAFFGRTEIWNRCNSLPEIANSIRNITICNNK